MRVEKKKKFHSVDYDYYHIVIAVDDYNVEIIKTGDRQCSSIRLPIEEWNELMKVFEP